jgi:hypothetical protein
MDEEALVSKLEQIWREGLVSDPRAQLGRWREREPDNKHALSVEYLQKPLGVADRETRLVEKLPQELEGVLPTAAQIEAEFAPKRRGKR